MTTESEPDAPPVTAEQVEQALESFRQGSPAEFDRLVNEGDDKTSGVCTVFADIINLSASGPNLPERIGKYRILREIGRGGMAVVYEAQQESTGRSVALKVISRLAPAGERGVRLFHREVDTLARLKHPGIGTLFDAGQTADGHHYFAMELVGGETLAAYLEHGDEPVEGRREHIRTRLELFCGICRAMAYAHQHGVIHCDLKPSNIFIDADGSPKILDFGLARLLDAERTYLTSILDSGRIVGTLQYMSPEQARGDADNIDTRSDVYALGVILYQMLTGVRPYEARSSSLPEAIRNICEQPPRRPSAVKPELRSDLETIILKALSKEPELRYQSANGLADDIERYLTQQPILARHPSAIYQLQKMIARHKAPAALAAALGLVVLVSAVLLGIQTARVSRERDNARSEARRAEQINQYLQRMLPSFDPRAVGPSVLVREVLDKAAVGIDAELADEPEVRATMHDTIGRGYMALRQFDQAERHLQAALELWKSLHGEVNADYARSLHYLGLTCGQQGRGAECERMLHRAYEIRRQLFGDEHQEIAESLHGLALHRKDRGDFLAAEQLCRQALDMRRRLLGESRQVAESLHSLGRLLVEGARFDDAESFLEQAIEMERRALGSESYDLALTLSDLGEIYGARAQYDLAEQAYREQIRILEKVFFGQPNHFESNALSDLATTLEMKGAFAEAESLHQQSIEMRRSLVGDRSVHLALNLNNYAAFLRNQGRFKEAEPLVREVYRLWADVNSDATATASAYASQNLAIVMLELGRYDDANRLYEDAIGRWRRIGGEDNPRLTRSLMGRGRLLQLQGAEAEAEQLFRQVCNISRVMLREGDPVAAEAALRLAVSLQEQGKPGAEEMGAAAVATLRSKQGESSAEVSWGLSQLGAIQLAAGRLDEAAQSLREAVSVERLLQRAKHPVLADGLRGSAEVLLARDDAESAEPLLREALAIQEERYNVGDPRTALTESALGDCLTLLGRFEDAEGHLLAAQATLESRLGPQNPKADLTRRRLVDLYTAWGKQDQAARWAGHNAVKP